MCFRPHFFFPIPIPSIKLLQPAINHVGCWVVAEILSEENTDTLSPYKKQPSLHFLAYLVCKRLTLCVTINNLSTTRLLLSAIHFYQTCKFLLQATFHLYNIKNSKFYQTSTYQISFWFSEACSLSNLSNRQSFTVNCNRFLVSDSSP